MFGMNHSMILLFSVITAFLAGALASLALAPLSLLPLAPLSSAVFWWLLQQQPQAGGRLGFSYGLGYFLVGVSWVYISMIRHGNTAMPLALLLTLIFCASLALFYAFLGYLTNRFGHTRSQHALLFISLWLLLDLLRGWLLTGFPWLYLGYAAMDTWLDGWAPWLGVHGLTLLILFSAILLLRLLLGYGRWSSTLGLFAIWLSGLALQQLPLTQDVANGVRQVTLLQGNVPLKKKWLPQHLNSTLAYYYQQTQQHLDSDVVVWPETAIATYWDLVEPTFANLMRQAEAQKTIVVSGVVWRSGSKDEPKYHNSLVAFGAEQGQYHKQRLVPFGEYIPWESQLRGLIAFFDLPMSNLHVPLVDQGLLTDGATPLASSICYEITYASSIARLAHQGSAMLTVSNDSWFDKSAAPWQHLQMARLRALENGRPLIRATNSGVSALIDHRGKIIAMAEPFVRTEIIGHITLQQGRTPFSYWHNWPVIIFGLLGLLLALYLNQRRH